MTNAGRRLEMLVGIFTSFPNRHSEK